MDATLGLVEKEYVLYIKDSCPFCVEAKALLESKNIKFRSVSFDKRPKVLQEMKEIYNWKTVPMVFCQVNTKTYRMIGGFTDLQKELGAGQ